MSGVSVAGAACVQEVGDEIVADVLAIPGGRKNGVAEGAGIPAHRVIEDDGRSSHGGIETCTLTLVQNENPVPL